jgi:hypothetical protein
VEASVSGDFFGVKIVNARSYEREIREMRDLGGIRGIKRNTRKGVRVGYCRYLRGNGWALWSLEEIAFWRGYWPSDIG